MLCVGKVITSRRKLNYIISMSCFLWIIEINDFKESLYWLRKTFPNSSCILFVASWKIHEPISNVIRSTIIRNDLYTPVELCFPCVTFLERIKRSYVVRRLLLFSLISKVFWLVRLLRKVSVTHSHFIVSTFNV